MSIFLLLLLLSNQHAVVSPCAKIYQTCCSTLKTTDIVNSRFPDNPAISYTEPDIIPESDCQSAQIDCFLAGMDTGMYTLVYSDGNGNILKTKSSLKSPVFNTNASDISCDTGYQNRDVFLSCEHGCTTDVCGPIKDCSCSPMLDVEEAQGLPIRYKNDVIYGDDCQNITVICSRPQNETLDYLQILLMDRTEKGGYFEAFNDPVGGHTFALNVVGWTCQNSEWWYKGRQMQAFISSCFEQIYPG